MEEDAEKHAEEDQKLRELVDLKNAAEAMIHSVQKTMTEHKDKVTDDEKSTIESAIKDLEDAIKTGNKEEIEAKNKVLAEASQKLGEKVYADQQAQQGQPKGNEGQGGGEEKTIDAEVVDAEYQEVKSEEKKQDKKEDKKEDK